MKKRLLVGALGAMLFITTAGFVKQDFFEIAKQIEIFTTLFKELNMNYVDQVEPATLMDKAIKGMLEDLDPYTVYWNEQQVQDARIKNSGTYTGIGATVRTLADRIVIVEPFEGYPADKAGLKAGDQIVRIGDIDLSGFDDDAGELLKGVPGSEVSLTYLRQGKQEKTRLVREKVAVKAVPFYKLLDQEIGYIVLSRFSRTTSMETRAALEELKAEGARSIILDLRGNPGGLLTEAINVVNLFVPKGEVITTTKSVIEKYNKTYRTRKEPVDTEIPLAVLVNGRSASASEIVSGGLQDLDRAVIVGARSFGKGLVQRPKKLTYGTQLKVTISRYYTPSGRCIQALDYWNRDENGDPIRLDPKEYNAFKTKGGRTVYDGGGILPDIEVESARFSPITTALLKDNAIFDYATDYYYANDLENWEGFDIDESAYQDFLSFLKKKGFSYQTETEIAFEAALRRAEDDDLKKNIMSGYRELERSIDQAKQKALLEKREQISGLIEAEILKRYFYREGMYRYQLRNSPEIREAIAVLNDQKKYQRILK